MSGLRVSRHGVSARARGLPAAGERLGGGPGAVRTRPGTRPGTKPPAARRGGVPVLRAAVTQPCGMPHLPFRDLRRLRYSMERPLHGLYAVRIRRMKGHKVGSVVTIQFSMADQDPDRAARTLRQALRRALKKTRPWRRVKVLEAHSLQPPDPLEMDPANPVAPMWREQKEAKRRAIREEKLR